MMKAGRRTFVKRGLVSGALGLFSSSVFASLPTPSEAEGPFYPLVAQKDMNHDLSKIEGKQGIAKGKVIVVQGQVFDTNDKPIEEVGIDLWQANAAGRYRHPNDRNKEAPLDPNFQGWAILQSGKEGRFSFVTIYPGAYPAMDTWIRPPHIYFKVSKKGYVELTTQMYFPNQSLNDTYRLLLKKSKEEAKRMMASKVIGNTETYTFNFVLQKV